MYTVKKIFAAITALTLCCAVSVSNIPMIISAETSSVYSADSTDYIIREINAVRAENGLNPVNISELACAAANIRAEELKHNFSHTRPDNQSSFTALDEQNIYYTTAAENIARTNEDSAADAVKQWTESETNLANILNAKFDSIGIGYHYDAEDKEAPFHWVIFLLDGNGKEIMTQIPVDYIQTATAEINKIRIENDAKTVTVQDSAVQAALVRAKELAQSFSHERPDGTMPYTALQEQNVAFQEVAENIVRTSSPDPALAIETWKNSEGHFRNIIDETYTDIGIACYYDSDSTAECPYYWCLFLFSCSENETDTDNEQIDHDNQTEALLEQINAFRKENNLSVFTSLSQLNQAADLRAAETIQTFGHTRPDGSDYATILNELHIDYATSTELVAAGNADAEKTLAQWLNAESTKELLMSETYSYIGIGYAEQTGSDYQHYWTVCLMNTAEGLSEKLLGQVNAYRTESGLSPLTMQNELSSVANIRAEELAQNFSYTRPDGSDHMTVLNNLSFSYEKAEELLAAGKSDAVKTLDLWMDSESHRSVLMSDSYQHAGVGFFSDPDSQYHYYWTIWLTDETEAGFLLGDPSEDKQINILDVILINRAVLGREKLSDAQNKACDVNKNGTVDSSDSLLLLKYIVGLIDQF